MSANDDMFLTDEQLVKLTGRKFKAKQREQLKVMGIPFKAKSAIDFKRNFCVVLEAIAEQYRG